MTASNDPSPARGRARRKSRPAFTEIDAPESQPRFRLPFLSANVNAEIDEGVRSTWSPWLVFTYVSTVVWVVGPLTWMMHRGATWTQAFLLTGLGLWPLVTVLTFAMRAKNKRTGKAASRLGWDPTSANLWCGVEAMPVNASTGPTVMTSMHGMWRGHLSESTTLGPGRRGSLTFSRVELMELPGSLPLLEIMCRGKNAAAEASGDDDFQVSSTAFDKNFRVVAPNREFARAVLHPRMVERLLREDARELSLTIVGSRVMVWSVPPATLDDLESRLNVMADVIDLIPADAYARWESEPVVMPSDSTKKNWMALVAVVLSYSIILTPVGIILGHRALRASRSGLSTNGRLALIALMGGYLVLGISVIALVAM